ncbi:SspB family protein [Hoeflea poritis]|uniref:SspB family protein n=1 Tax=Hoeflea poritis TaxID=2993659 RepID=A0ABT4VP15_9HYPH|nr:SspB family protein [Hoeflea poritis]MDA4846448.1 SspB family protein [Hoeflea poritis]
MQDHIRYDILAQEALRGVIRKVLSEVAATGSLPGEHHFFITFLTNAPGVRISPYLKEKYSEQMTIVIQHQFWDLKVTDSYFEIGLSFSDKPEKLHIPFAAIRGFYDPSVNFELEFDTMMADNEDLPAETISIAETEEDAPEAEADTEAGDTTAATEAEPAATEGEDGDDKSGADVVSLDAFRKKN